MSNCSLNIWTLFIIKITCCLFRVNQTAPNEERGKINVGLYITTRKIHLTVVNGCGPTKRVIWVYRINNLVRLEIGYNEI